MLRVLLVSVEFKITSYTRFAADLKENHLPAIISGFSVGDTPGTGTFYDFHNRLWLSDNKNLSKSFHPPKEKPQKPKGKEEKAAPVEKVTVEDLFRQFEENPPSDMAPCLRLWEIFNTFFLQTSVDKNLISLKELALAGDGTPLYTSAQEHKTRTCDCLEKGIRDCKCDRIYHQPDCDIGWGSHRNCFYAAVEPKKGRVKYRCSKITCKGGSPHCTCEEPCSDAKYGRNVHLILEDNPRLFNDPPRGSEKWKLEFNARTSAERCNKREKIDYKLEDGRYRSSMMWYCRLFAIMMCQHLDAWNLSKSSRLKDLFEQAA